MQEIVVDQGSSVKTPVAENGSLFRPAFAALAVALSYYLGAKFGIALTFQPNPVSTLWPPNAILFAAFVLTPKRWWWLFITATLVSHLVVEVEAEIPITMVLCWFISNCAEALIGATLVRYSVKGKVDFNKLQHVVIVLLAGLLGTFLSSFLDAAFVKLNAWGTGSYWYVFRMRFASNLLATVTLVPAILAWSEEGIEPILNRRPSRLIEAAALTTALLIICTIIFELQDPNATPALLYATLPLLVWAAIRFGPRGTSAALLAVGFFTIWGTLHGHGPFHARSAEVNALSVQLFLILTSLPVLFLAAVIQERKRAESVARQNEDRLAMALDAAQMGTWSWQVSNNAVEWSDKTKRMFGLLPGDNELTQEKFLELLHPDDRQLVEQSVANAVNHADPLTIEFRIVQPSGAIRWIRGKGKVLRDERDKSVRMIGLNADITDQKFAEEALTRSEEKLRQSHRQVSALARKLLTVQDSEQRRIARQLHDDLSQKLAALSLGISSLKRRVSDSNGFLRKDLEQLREQADDLTNDIRQLSHHLHPAVLEHLGLVPALQAYIDEFHIKENVEVNLSAQITTKRIPLQISVCLYRVAIEALRNVARHSGAKAANIALMEDEHSLSLKISDHGRGFNVEHALHGDGLGLVSAEERVRLLEGVLEVKSHEGNGTTVFARIPLDHLNDT
jgi:PAS domain S-box-containing protein